MYLVKTNGSVSHCLELRDNAHSHCLIERAADKETELRRAGEEEEVNKTRV